VENVTTIYLDFYRRLVTKNDKWGKTTTKTAKKSPNVITRHKRSLENPGIDPGTSRMLSGRSTSVFLEAFAEKKRPTAALKCF